MISSTRSPGWMRWRSSLSGLSSTGSSSAASARSTAMRVSTGTSATRSAARQRRDVDRRQVQRERAALCRPRCVSRISPPSSLAISRLIDRPRPVPPYLRLVVPSACWNASKMTWCLSGANADAGVFDRKATTLVARSSDGVPGRPAARRRLDRQGHRALLGELDRVRDQVLQHLLHALLVGDDRARSCADRGRPRRSGPCCRRLRGRCARRTTARRPSDTGTASTSIMPDSIFDRSRISLISSSRSEPEA